MSKLSQEFLPKGCPKLHSLSARPSMTSLQPTLTEGVEEFALRAKAKLEAQDYTGAAMEGSRALDILPNLAEISIVRGHALLSPLLDSLMGSNGTMPVREDFKGAYDAFRLALIMDPSSAEAAMELERLGELLKRLPDMIDQPAEVVEIDEPGPRTANSGLDDVGLDVIVIGAGAAGIGCAFTLTNTFGLEPSRVLLLERGEAVGTSFRMWPNEMRYAS
jgi:hypothetical protein